MSEKPAATPRSRPGLAGFHAIAGVNLSAGCCDRCQLPVEVHPRPGPAASVTLDGCVTALAVELRSTQQEVRFLQNLVAGCLKALEEPGQNIDQLRQEFECVTARTPGAETPDEGE